MEQAFSIDQVALALRLLGALSKQVRSAGGQEADIAALLVPEGEGVLEHIAQVAVARRLGHFPTDSALLELSAGDLIERGRYDNVTSALEEILWEQWSEGSRPSSEPAHLVSYPSGLTTHEVIERMAANGLRPGRAVELLVYGAGYHDLPSKANKGLAALGDTFHDDQGPWNPVITVNGLGRSLAGDYRDWEEPWLFLAYKADAASS